MNGGGTSARAPERAARTWLIMISGWTAVLATGGAVGLATGTMLDPVSTARLPWHSAGTAATALLVVVAAPMAIVAVLAQRRHPAYRTAAVVAGCLLIAWIAVEIAFIRELSWLQAVFAVVGIVVLLLGLDRHSHGKG